ncbi:MAG: hypothetical protein ACK2VD_10425, partial [Anaerolineae bacterium]
RTPGNEWLPVSQPDIRSQRTPERGARWSEEGSPATRVRLSWESISSGAQGVPLHSVPIGRMSV